MPIIPAGWTNLSTVNVIGTGGSSKPFKYVKTFTVNSDNLTDYQPLIGYCSEDINREFSVEVIAGKIDFYWVNQSGELFIISQTELITGDELKDTDLDCLGVSFKCYENSEFFVTLRWDSDIDFYIYTGEDLMINPKIRLLLPTGANYPVNANSSSYDESNLAIYTENLNKLKNSNSGVTGYKLFDIFSFYPGKTIDFNVIVNNPNSIYGEIIAVQLFDPIDIAQSVIDISSDIINPESNSLPDSFIGNLTRNALYKIVSDGSVNLTPDFSRHVGRIVAQNINNNNYFDTAIIESYTPNTNPLLGGTFTLTGEF